MISLSDQQLAILMDAAHDLPPEKRDSFLRHAAKMSAFDPKRTWMTPSGALAFAGTIARLSASG